jgi:hypothetical protein
MEFKAFPKIARYDSQKVVVTEKIDGTNGLIYINGSEIRAGSRTRWLDMTSEGDNFGFAKWVNENSEELLKLGDGYHYGEWWGANIQRGYGVTQKRFSLFNTSRWNVENKPQCCEVVPVIFSGTHADYADQWQPLKESLAAPGYIRPEGEMVYFIGSDRYMKFIYG